MIFAVVVYIFNGNEDLHQHHFGGVVIIAVRGMVGRRRTKGLVLGGVAG